MSGMLRGSRGQSTVELVAIAPLVVLCGLLGLQALVAGATYVTAGNAAHAGALAGQLGHAPERAAREAAPGWSSGSVSVSVRARRVRVRVRPRAIVPPLAGLLTASAEARYTRQ
ncbi:MAG: hypothetical protein QM648_03670 [Solirubrobacterales bacterium]